MKRVLDDDLAYEILSAVGEIPEGRVASYGQIADLIGRPRGARLVGKVLSMAEFYGDFPCHRVVNAKGELADRYAYGGAEKQVEILMSEGVEVAEGRVDLRRFQWKEFAGNREKRD